MNKILTPFLSEAATSSARIPATSLSSPTSSRALKASAGVDRDVLISETFTNQRARLYHIKNGQPSKIAEELKDIFGPVCSLEREPGDSIRSY